MSEYPLTLPQPCLDALQAQLDKHNQATGADLQLRPYLERVILEIAGMPALQEAMPRLEKDRDEGFQDAVKAEQERISQALTGGAP